MEQKINFREQSDNHKSIRVNKRKQAKVVFNYGTAFLVLFLFLFLLNLTFDIHREYLDIIFLYRTMLVVFLLSMTFFIISYIFSEKADKLQDEHLRIEKNSVLK